MNISHSLPRVTLGDAKVRPQLDFILPGLLAQSVGMIVGQGGVGKSSLALGIGLGVAIGRPVSQGLWEAQKIGPVTIIFGEDDSAILQERLFWLRQAESLTDSEAAMADENLFVYSARGLDMRIFEKTRDGFAPLPFLNVLKRYCQGQRLVIVDPLLFLNGGEENDNGAAAVLMSYLYSITKETGCTIILLHHVGKSNGDREEWAAARGASAITTSVRWQVNMSPPSPKEMNDYEIGNAMRNSWVRIAIVKSNYGDSGEVGWLNRINGGVLVGREMLKIGKPKPIYKKTAGDEYGENW